MNQEDQAAARCAGKKSGAVKKAAKGYSRVDMESMESDVAAKARARSDRTAALSASAKNGGVDIAAKIRQASKPTSNDMSPISSSSSSLRRDQMPRKTNLSNLDQRISAKVAASGTPIATIHLAGKENDTSFAFGQPDSKISASSHSTSGISISPSSASRVTIQTMESDAGAKARAASILGRFVPEQIQQRSKLPTFSLVAEKPRFSGQVTPDGHLSSDSAKNAVIDALFPDDEFKFLPSEPPIVIESKRREEASDMILDPASQWRKGDDKEGVLQDLEFNFNGTEKGGGMAVAVAVEDDEDKYIPAAVEFDPDAKPPVYQNRRFRLYSSLVCGVIVVAIVATSIGISLVKRSAENESDTSTALPLPYRETIGIKEKITRIIGNDALESAESPFVAALDWITHKDPMMLLPDATNFVQRFILAYVHFATSLYHPWSSCTYPVGNETEDCLFNKLVGFTPNLTKTPVPWKRWLTNLSECEWAGIYCNENEQVRAVEISGMSSNGYFPVGLKYLTFLQSFNMAHSELYGTLPPGIGELKHLINIELQHNLLSGTLPAEWFSGSIQRINLAQNVLTGTLPASIDETCDIKGLYIYGNLFSGPIPVELIKPRGLSYLRFEFNMLSGSIPESFGYGQNLVEVMIQKNWLTGSIPSILGEQLNLEDFRVNSNFLTGELPDSLYNMTKAFRIELSNNNLSGTISTAIGQLTSLVELKLKNNDFTGMVPTELGSLLKLESVWLQANGFVGSIPDGLCGVYEVEADCSVPETGWAQIVCPSNCCTTCCESDGEICLSPSL